MFVVVLSGASAQRLYLTTIVVPTISTWPNVTVGDILCVRRYYTMYLYNLVGSKVKLNRWPLPHRATASVAMLSVYSYYDTLA